jgi:serpin B
MLKQTLRKRIATLLALGMLTSVGVVNVSANAEPIPTEDSNTYTIMDVLQLKELLASTDDLTEYISDYDYNHDDTIDYIDLLTLKKDILNVDETLTDTPTMTKVTAIDGLSTNMRKDIMDFSIDMFKQQVQEDENTIVSPESLYLLLGMTVNGASGITLQEIKNALFKDVSMEEFNNSMAYLVNGNDEEICNVANSIWVREEDGIQLNEDFKDYSEEYFNAEVHVQPFDGILVKDVNAWVKEHTNGMIPSILEDVPSQDLMCLINAISFEGRWAEDYEDYSISENRTFTNSQGEEQKVTMLYSTEYVYLSDDDATGFLKYYDGNRYAFMGILPNEGISVEDYVNNLTGDKFTKLYSNQRTSNMVLSVGIPEFTSTGDYNLISTLQNMGINRAFTSNAEFDNMLNTDVQLTSVFQKAFIQLDRYGTKAAAVSTIMVGATAVDTRDHFNVILDRPFAYAIVDTETNLPIFIGVVNNVKSPENLENPRGDDQLTTDDGWIIVQN